MTFSTRPVLVGICATLVALMGCSDDDPTQPGPVPMTLVAADRSGNIVTVSETTGAETMIIDTFTDSGAGNVDVGVVSSMIYEPTTKKCDFCQSEISIKATRCPNCTSELSAS